MNSPVYPGTAHLAPQFPNGSFRAQYSPKSDSWTLVDGSRWVVHAAYRNGDLGTPSLFMPMAKSAATLGTLYPVIFGADSVNFGKRWEGTLAEAYQKSLSGLVFAPCLPSSGPSKAFIDFCSFKSTAKSAPAAVHAFGV
jgi:hypothetical protein